MSNTYAVTLQEIRNGASLEELSIELAKLLTAVKETGRAGSLVHKIVVKPLQAGDSTTVQVEDEITAKMPKPQRKASIFYMTEDGRLQRSDPRQKEFNLQTIPKPAEVAPVVVPVKETQEPVSIPAVNQ